MLKFRRRPDKEAAAAAGLGEKIVSNVRKQSRRWKRCKFCGIIRSRREAVVDLHIRRKKCETKQKGQQAGTLFTARVNRLRGSNLTGNEGR